MPPLDSPVLFDGDSGFRALVTRSRASQLKPGEVAVSKNMRFEESGTAKVREGYDNVSGVILSQDVFPFLVSETGTAAIVLIGTVSSCTASAAGTTVTVICPTAHGIPATGGMVNLASFTGGTGNFLGNRKATYVTANKFSVQVAGISGSWTGGVVGAAKLTGGSQAIYGACRFTNPNSNNDEYIIIADNENATAIKLSDFSATTISYPGETVTGDAHLQQEFDVVMLRQDGKTPYQFDPDDSVYGFGGSDSSAPAFQKVSSGTYTQPLILAATNIAITDAGKVTLTRNSHNLTTGDQIEIIAKGDANLTNGDKYNVTVDDANDFHFFADIDETGHGTGNTKVSARVSLGGGFQHHPASAWGTYHNRRVWVPYTHTSAGSPARRSPAIYDELIASDILSNDTFDTIYNQFRLSGGTADYIVGAQAYDDDRLIVFNRNSIHQLLGTSGGLADVRVHLLTNEMGCLARRSIVYHAGNLLFLSDNGVMGVTFADNLNLRGLDKPLSEPIDSEIKRINRAHADKAVACIHDNKLWLAVPTGTSEVCNEIFIFNFLTQGWESIDSTSADNWGVVDLIPSRTNKVNELFAVTQDGGLHQLDQTGLGLDNIAPAAGAPITVKYRNIPAHLRTRGYTHGTLERKRFQHLEVHVLADEHQYANGNLALVTEDPDRTTELGDIKTMLGSVLQKGEGASIRTRTGNPRGFACQVDWMPSAGSRSELRAVSVRATNTFNSPTSAQ